MYLSNFNSVIDAAEWLSENTEEPWSWKNVIDMFLQTDPETVGINIPLGAPLLRLSPGDIQEYAFNNPVRLEVCNVKDFLEDILMGDNFESACANPLALVCGPVRFRSPISIRASAIRLTKIEIHQLAERFTLYPFRKLIREVQKSRLPELAALIQYRDHEAVTSNGAQPGAPTSSAATGVQESQQAEALQLPVRDNGQAPAPPAEVPTLPPADEVPIPERWTLKQPQRADILANAIYAVLKDALDSGKPLPRTRDVMRLCAKKNPHDVLEVTYNEIKFYDRDDNTKTADIYNVRKRIERMTSA